MRRAVLLLALVLWPVETVAENPPVPQPRPAAEHSGGTVPLPRIRPAAPDASGVASEPAVAGEPPAAPPVSEESGAGPAPQTPRDYQAACPAVLAGEVEATPLPTISEGQCGLRSPLKITGIRANGRMIPLSAPATLDCGMASALPGWLSDVDSYAQSHDGSDITRLGVSTSYACRNVDNQKDGNLSFHAFGDALDVIGLDLDDGRKVTIAGSWNATPRDGRDLIRYAHDSACSRFTTVLGPDADSFHQDNLHLDLGCHGRSCTYRLCQ